MGSVGSEPPPGMSWWELRGCPDQGQLCAADCLAQPFPGTGCSICPTPMALVNRALDTLPGLLFGSSWAWEPVGVLCNNCGGRQPWREWGWGAVWPYSLAWTPGTPTCWGLVSWFLVWGPGCCSSKGTGCVCPYS